MMDRNLKLIEAVKKHDCLYNVDSAQYKKFAYKEHLWNKIGKEVGLRSSQAKSKWKNLRDSYKKYKHIANSGNTNRKQYKYAEDLKFLDNVVSYRPYKSFFPKSDMEVSTDLSSYEEFLYEQPENGQAECNFENYIDDEMPDFSESSSTTEVKIAADNIATTDTKDMLNSNTINEENLITEEKNSDFEGPISNNSFEEDEKTNEKDLNEILIVEVKKYDCIYNLQSTRYKHFSYKKHLWHRIGKRVGLPANGAIKKWKNLKDTYRKYKIKLMSQVGFIKPYKYAESLKFLDDYIDCRPSISKVINEPEVSTDLSSDGDIFKAPTRMHKRRKGSYGKIQDSEDEYEPENQKTMTSRLFMVLANKVNEANLTIQQKNAIEFGVSSYVYSKLAEYIKK